MAANSVDKFVESFENPTIDGEPTYATIHAMHELLNFNVAYVNTNLGCGSLRHLCITLSLTFYATLLVTQAVPPPNPGATLVVPVGTTRPEAVSIRYAHDAATLTCNTFQNVYHALRQQRMGAVEENCVRVKHRPHQGCSGSSTLDLLTRLYKTYTIISNAEWIANNKRFRKAYSPTDPIEVIWRQIDDPVAYPNAGSTPYSTKQVVDNTYQIVFNTGIFAADFREWNKRAAVDKTLPNIKVFFVAAHREWRFSNKN